MKIHPLAVVSPEAKIGQNVEIGPFAVIESDVEIGDNCVIDAHVKIDRYTKIGEGTRIYYGALIGSAPQDHRFNPEIVSYTEIGKNTVLREYVTIHRSPFANQKTIVGDNVLLMGFVHVGHDCNIGNRVTIANNTAVSGHVQIGDGAVLSGYVLIHQFCRIGSLAMVGARAIIVQDIPPYCLLSEGGFIVGPNTIGLRRAGMEPERRSAIRRAVKNYFFYGYNSQTAIAEISKNETTPEVDKFVEFVKSTKRGIASGDPDMIYRKESQADTDSDTE